MCLCDRSFITYIIISLIVSVPQLRLMGDVLLSCRFHSDSFFFILRNTLCGVRTCCVSLDELLMNFFFHKLKLELEFMKVQIKCFFILATVHGIIFIQCLHIVRVLSVTLLTFIISAGYPKCCQTNEC